MFDETARAKYSLYLAIFLFFIGYAGSYTGLEPLHNQFFPFAAWCYILFADNLAWRLKKYSPLISRPEEFFFLAAWSLALGALAELLNLRLGAWGYIDVCTAVPARWSGRLASWAAALPSLFVTAELLGLYGFFGKLRSPRFTLAPRAPEAFALGGWGLLAISLALPARAWPLAIPALFLMAESLNLKLGLPSLLRELAGGMPGKALRLAVAGFICGILWNWWNSASGASWEYYLPSFFGTHRWAALPGFPMLALCAYSLYSAASWLRAGNTWEPDTWPRTGKRPSLPLQLSVAFILIITSYIALRATDAFTVKLYLGWL